MGKVKILHIIASSNIGGGERAFCSLLKYLDKDKFDIFVICPEGGLLLNDFKRYATELRIMNFKNWLDPLKIISLKKYMQEKQIDIVHTHLYSADFMGVIAARLARVPCRLSTIHGYNFKVIDKCSLRSIKNFFCSFLYRSLYIFCGFLANS